MDIDISVVLESIDHRLELLNTKIDNSMEGMQTRIDSVRESTVSTDVCATCQQSIRSALQEMKESMVSKMYFKAISAAIGFMVLVAGLLSAWGRLIG